MYIMELQNWIGNNIQDWAFFQLIQIGRIFIKEKFLLHNLIEDCTSSAAMDLQPFQRMCRGLEGYKVN